MSAQAPAPAAPAASATTAAPSLPQGTTVSPSPPSPAPAASPPVGSPPAPQVGAPEPATPAEVKPDGVPERTWKAVQEAEAKVRESRTKFEAERKAFEADKGTAEQYKQVVEEYRKAQDEYNADPIVFLTNRGFTQEDIARRLLNAGQPSVEEAMRRADGAAEQGRKAAEAEAQKAIREVQNLRQELVLKEYRGDLKSHLTSNSSKYGLLLSQPDRSLDMAMNEAGLAAQAGHQLTHEEVLDRVLVRHVEYLKTLTSNEAALKALRDLIPQANSSAPSPAVPPVPNLTPGSGSYASPSPSSGGAQATIDKILSMAHQRMGR